MKRFTRPLCSAVTLLALTCSAQAQTIKPGLWQVNNKMSSANPETDLALSSLLGAVASLPPEQRQQLEAMAAGQGMSMPTVTAGGAIAVNSCITPEMAARKQIPTGQPGNCSSNNVPLSDGMQIAFSCTDPASSGKGRLRYIGDSAFDMTLDVTTSARGKPEQMKVVSSGKWLGATCPAAAR